MEEQEINLADYFWILWRRKWIVILTFLVAVVLAFLVARLQPKQYEVTTSLVIMPPLAQEVGGRLSGPVFSPETYKNLALARDLLEEVIREIDPRRERYTVEEIQEAMKVTVEQTAAKDFPGQFPLYLRVTFRGTKPQELRTLAESWAKHFIARNAEIFTTKTAQSFEYVLEAFNQVEQELLAKEGERVELLQNNPVQVLEAEVAVLQREYESYLRDLQQKRNELVSKEATLSALQARLAEEPEFLVLERSVSNEALWNFLAQGTDPQKLATLPSLVLQDQQLNSVHMSLRAQLASTQVAVETLRREIAHLEEALTVTEKALLEKQASLVELKTRIEQIDRDISVLKGFYTTLASRLQDARLAKAETAACIRLVEAPVTPTRPVGTRLSLSLATAGVLGLFLGVFLAFFLHWLQTGPRPEEKTGTENPKPEA